MTVDPNTKEIKYLQTALLIGVFKSGNERTTCDENLNELARLCDTYGLTPVDMVACSIKKFEAGTYLGSGKINELVALADAKSADVIIFDDEISPHQQRNLEELFKRPVIDRTELIIEVFAKSARTREARLQVEHAQIKYQFPRLKRLWTHLGRQTGSGGGGGGAYLRGAGETQIEMDRRTLRRRLTQVEAELEAVKDHRETQRSGRLRSGIPTFAIIGYTNAGKSTLLNTLTKAGVLVEDKLFATLDTTTRKFTLPNKQEVLLIDTVGFIRKIPHALLAAFRSTLEEAVHTDILLHLIDVSHPMAEQQAESTYHVLEELKALDHPIITVLNKIDQCSNPAILQRIRLKYPKTVQISALHGTGFDHLMDQMIQEISALRKIVKLRIPQSHYVLVSELLREGRVISSEYDENDVILEVEIPSQLEYKVQSFLWSK
jgi:GTP-binding protein HflX